MIGQLSGEIVLKHPPEITLSVQGVGYEVQLPMHCFYELPEVGGQVTLWTHLVVREDAQLLFGFNTLDERALFRTLIKAQGVGPKLAMTIMSSLSVEAFVIALSQEKMAVLTKIPGVGKKTAERLIVELKDKLKDFVGFEHGEADLIQVDENKGERAIHDAVSALVSLGYKEKQAEKTVQTVAKDLDTEGDVETLIRHALKMLM